MRSKAYCPGHITGFFAIFDEDKDFRKKGSRGAGICLSRGALSTVEVESAEKQIIRIYINGKEAKAPVTRLAIQKLLSKKPLEVMINTELELPVSQGFGMSGAGALSAVLATAQALKLNSTYNDLVAIAHEAEVRVKTGLGDVVAQATGGFTIRKKEGLPPFGFVDNILLPEREVVLCVIGKGILTKKVLTNPVTRKRIIQIGSECLKKLVKNPTLQNFFELSNEFSIKTKLIRRKVLDAIKDAQKYGCAAMAMLGNSIFAMGDVENLVRILKKYGEVYLCEVELNKARLVD